MLLVLFIILFHYLCSFFFHLFLNIFSQTKYSVLFLFQFFSHNFLIVPVLLRVIMCADLSSSVSSTTSTSVAWLCCCFRWNGVLILAFISQFRYYIHSILTSRKAAGRSFKFNSFLEYISRLILLFSIGTEYIITLSNPLHIIFAPVFLDYLGISLQSYLA